MADSARTAGAISGTASGAASGAMIGSVVPGLGTVAGGIIGGVIGGISGAFGRKKRKAPKRASGAVYGYDSYGNVVSKGRYAYNASSGQYELRAGELSGQEKAMRRDLADNIYNLINTVGSTPDAFVRYAKELSASYSEGARRQYDEDYEKALSRTQENLARRGLSTSRAAADISSEMETKRLNSLQDIYNAATQYGFNAQQSMMNQARASLGTLTGYQGQLAGQDQSYLAQALQAQQLGQAYENAKAGVDNANIDMSNKAWQGVGQTLNQFGTLAGYYKGAQALQGSANLGGTQSLDTQQAKNVVDYQRDYAPWSLTSLY